MPGEKSPGLLFLSSAFGSSAGGRRLELGHLAHRDFVWLLIPQKKATLTGVDGLPVGVEAAFFRANPDKPGTISFVGPKSLLNLYRQLLAALESGGAGGPPDVKDAIGDAQAGTTVTGTVLTTTLTQAAIRDLTNTLTAFNEGTWRAGRTVSERGAESSGRTERGGKSRPVLFAAAVRIQRPAIAGRTEASPGHGGLRGPDSPHHDRAWHHDAVDHAVILIGAGGVERHPVRIAVAG